MFFVSKHKNDELICKTGNVETILNILLRSIDEDKSNSYTEYAYNITVYILENNRLDFINYIITNKIRKQELMSMFFIAAAVMHDHDKMKLFLDNHADINNLDEKRDAAIYKVIYFFSLSNTIEKPDIIDNVLSTIQFLLDNHADTSFIQEDIDYLINNTLDDPDICIEDAMNKKKVYEKILEMI